MRIEANNLYTTSVMLIRFEIYGLLRSHYFLAMGELSKRFVNVDTDISEWVLEDKSIKLCEDRIANITVNFRMVPSAKLCNMVLRIKYNLILIKLRQHHTTTNMENHVVAH